MTTGEPSRIERLEALAETILLAIQQQSGQIAGLQASVEDVVGMIGSLGNEMHEMHEMQTEIRGLQTENRRILEILQNRLDS